MVIFAIFKECRTIHQTLKNIRYLTEYLLLSNFSPKLFSLFLIVKLVFTVSPTYSAYWLFCFRQKNAGWSGGPWSGPNPSVVVHKILKIKILQIHLRIPNGNSAFDLENWSILELAFLTLSVNRYFITWYKPQFYRKSLDSIYFVIYYKQKTLKAYYEAYYVCRKWCPRHSRIDSGANAERNYYGLTYRLPPYF